MQVPQMGTLSREIGISLNSEAGRNDWLVLNRLTVASARKRPSLSLNLQAACKPANKTPTLLSPFRVYYNKPRFLNKFYNLFYIPPPLGSHPGAHICILSPNSLHPRKIIWAAPAELFWKHLCCCGCSC